MGKIAKYLMLSQMYINKVKKNYVMCAIFILSQHSQC
jgi:hypothetical protein